MERPKNPQARILSLSFARSLVWISALVLSSVAPVWGLERAPDIRVTEWLGAFEAGHPSLVSSTTPELLLTLADDQRLESISTLLAGPKPAPKLQQMRIQCLSRMGEALDTLVKSGHLRQAAKIDKATFAASARLDYLQTAALSSAGRLAAAGDRESLLRLAETLLLVPECDRTSELEVAKEQLRTMRSITVPNIHQPVHGTADLIVLLHEQGLLDGFIELAEKRLADAPGDFKTLKTLTMAQLLRNGDRPELWTRVRDHASERIGHRMAFLSDFGRFCYLLRIPAPHFCDAVDEILHGADRIDVRYNSGAESMTRYLLLRACLWKDTLRMEEVRKLHEQILGSFDDDKPYQITNILERYPGLLVDSLSDPSLAPLLDQWCERLNLARLARRDHNNYRDILNACSWAVDGDLPPALVGKWLALADREIETTLNPAFGDPRPNKGDLNRHMGLLLHTGQMDRAKELLAEIESKMRYMSKPPVDVAMLGDYLKAATTPREPLLWKKSDGIRGTAYWRKGGEYLSPNSPGAVFIADQFPHKNGPERADLLFHDAASPSRWSESLAGMVGADGLMNIPFPDNPPSPELRVQARYDRGDLHFAEPQALPPYPNLLDGEWRVYNKHGLSPTFVRLESKGCWHRLQSRGTQSGGSKYVLMSKPVPLEDGVDYLLGGRVQAFGRAGVSVEFLDEHMTVLRAQRVTEHLDTHSPGERFFRTVIRKQSGHGPHLVAPPDAVAVRVVLDTSLNISATWSDVCLSRFRLSPSEGAAVSLLADGSEPFLEFEHPVAALAVSPKDLNLLVVGVPKAGEIRVYDLPESENPAIHRIPVNSRLDWLTVARNRTIVGLLGEPDKDGCAFHVFSPGRTASRIMPGHPISRPCLSSDGAWLAWMEKRDGKRELVVQSLTDTDRAPERVPLDLKEGGDGADLPKPGFVVTLNLTRRDQLLVRGYDWQKAYALPGLKEVEVRQPEKVLRREHLEGIWELSNSPETYSSCRMQAFPRCIFKLWGATPRYFKPGTFSGNTQQIIAVDAHTGRSVGAAQVSGSVSLGVLAVVNARNGRFDLFYVKGRETNKIYRVTYKELSQAGLIP